MYCEFLIVGIQTSRESNVTTLELTSGDSTIKREGLETTSEALETITSKATTLTTSFHTDSNYIKFK